MPDIDVKKREKLYASLCPALRRKVDNVVAWVKDDARYNLLNRHKLGIEIKEIFDDQTENGAKVYGKKAFNIISMFSGEDTSMLRVCMRMAQTWTRKQLEEIADMVMLDGVTAISYSHVRWLLTVENEQGRAEALNKTLENCWTSLELSKYIQSIYNRPQRQNAGRTCAPRTLDGLISQQSQYAEDFENRYTKVWNDERYSLPTQVQKLAPEQVTEELAKKVGELAARQRQLATQADEMANKTERQYKKLMDMLKKPVRITTDTQTSEEDAEDKPAPRRQTVGRRPLTITPL